MFTPLPFFQCSRTFDFQAAPANEGQCAERHVYDSSGRGFVLFWTSSHSKLFKWGRCMIHVCVWMFEIKKWKACKQVRTGTSMWTVGKVAVIARCFCVYASNLFILPLSRKRSAEITVWKDTVLSAEGERDSGTMECHRYSCQEHFSHAPGSQDFPQQPRIALLSSPNSLTHTKQT